MRILLIILAALLLSCDEYEVVKKEPIAHADEVEVIDSEEEPEVKKQPSLIEAIPALPVFMYVNSLCLIDGSTDMECVTHVNETMDVQAPIGALVDVVRDWRER